MQISKLKEKLNNPHLLSLATNGSMAALTMITYAVICRTLPLAERGVWLLFQSTVILTDCLRSGFLSTGFIGMYAGLGKGKARLVAGSAWYIALLITLGFCLLNIPSYLLAYH